MQLVVNALLTSYSVVGKGKQKVLFLHGWGDQGKTFEMLAKDLVKSKKYTAILLDLPGFGGTQGPPKGWGLDDYANFINEFLEKTEHSPKIIIGHSNGGAIAIRGLSSGILSAEKLVLIASAGIRKSSTKKKLLLGVTKSAKLGTKLLPNKLQQRIRQKLYSSIGSDYLVVEEMQDTFKKIVATDVTQDAANLSLPVCLIYGEKDNSTPPEYGQAFKQLINNSQLSIIPQAGHFVHQEQVYKVSKIVQEFIK